MIRRSALDEVGLLDERFFMYSEDEDLCWRFRGAKWLVCYTDSGHAVHHGGQSAKQDLFQNLCHFYRSQYMLLLKHRGPTSARTYLLANRTALLLKRIWFLIRGHRERLNEVSLRLKALQHARLAAADNRVGCESAPKI